jgi:mono/diheme cytochrome c family protein
MRFISFAFLASWRLGVHSLLLLHVLALPGCRKEDMAEQPRHNPHQPSAFFEDGNSARPLVEGTVSRDNVRSDAYEYDRTRFSTTAPSASALAAADFPADFPRAGEPLHRKLERGRERYNIYCAVCHSETGAGDGMIVQRGFIRPPAYYPRADDARNDPDLYRREQALLAVPPGYIYDKITNGYGAMYPYASRVAPEDRWAIAAYIRVLQLSRNAPVADLPDRDRQAIDAIRTGGTAP